MRYEAHVLILSLALLLSRSSAYAHHSFAAEYDSDKPVQITGTVTKVELIINLITAKTLGLALPQSLLGRADEVIE